MIENAVSFEAEIICFIYYFVKINAKQLGSLRNIMEGRLLFAVLYDRMIAGYLSIMYRKYILGEGIFKLLIGMCMEHAEGYKND